MFRISKIGNLSKKTKILINILAIIITVFIISLFLLVNKQNPFNIFINMLVGSFGNSFRITSTIKYSIPLITTALAISVAFKMKFWNIGAEGQIILGAIFASYFALFYNNILRLPLLVIMFVAAFVGGALYGLIPAILKVLFKTSETIVTLMLNYIGLCLVGFLQFQAWKDPKAMGFAKIATFKINAQLPKLFNLPVGWIFTIIIGIVVYYFFNFSKKGYEISVIGESENTAKYAGINIKLNTILVMLISGGICGIVGFLQVAGNINTLTVDVTMGVGYTAIIIAWLGNLDVIKIFVVGLLFSIMTQGGYYIQSTLQLNYNAVSVIQAIILFSALATTFFMNYKIVKVRKVVM